MLFDGFCASVQNTRYPLASTGYVFDVGIHGVVRWDVGRVEGTYPVCPQVPRALTYAGLPLQREHGCCGPRCDIQIDVRQSWWHTAGVIGCADVSGTELRN